MRDTTAAPPRRITTGLDSAVAFDIISALRARAAATGLGVVAALLQPTPEIYGLFDEVRLRAGTGVAVAAVAWGGGAM